VTGLNGAVALGLVVLLAVVALVVQPPSPPGIAEFAPQAAKPVTKAPPGQAARFGTWTGACAEGQVCSPAPQPTGTARAVAVALPRQGTPSALQCYEWPDGSVTQTLDPQSPPCIASWPDAANGNGGATSRGVSAVEIRLTISKAATSGYNERSYGRIVDFVNTHYQLYGRRLRLVVNNGGSAYEPSETHAAAQAALATDAFAAIGNAHDNAAFGHELAQHHMITVTTDVATGVGAGSAAMAADAPYVWTYQPPYDVTERNLGAFVCTSLEGRPAKFAAEQSNETRRFAIITQHGPNGGPRTDPAPLQQELAKCGLEPEVVTVPSSFGNTDTEGTQTVAQLRSRGVTTLLSLVACCNEALEFHASQSGWHPEWVYYGKDNQYPSVVSGTNASGRGQMAGKLSLAPANKVVALSENPAHRAAGSGVGYVDEDFYRSVQIIAAGAQMAGPDLTPRSFATALHTTVFPNPGAGAAPSYQAAVSAPTNEPWMIRDFAVAWPDAREPARIDYSLCFARSGRRWSLGTWVDIEMQISGGLVGC